MGDYLVRPRTINWTVEQLRLYRTMYDFMSSHQEDFTRHFACHIPDADWVAISRRASLYAAHNMTGEPAGTTLPADLFES